MKIALQLFGHLRTFEECYPHLKEHLLDHYDCDVFIHTWDKIDHNTQTWHNATDHQGVRTQVDAEMTDYVRDLYKAKSIEVSSQENIHVSGTLGLVPEAQFSLKGIHCMLFSQEAANKLRVDYEKQTGTTYDYVLVTRPDIMLLEKVELSRYENEFTFAPQTTVHFVFSVITDQRNEKFFTLGTMDLFYFGRPEAITIAAGALNEFDRYYRDYPRLAFGGIGCPELSFNEYLLRHQVVPRFYKFGMSLKRKDKTQDIVSMPQPKETLPPPKPRLRGRIAMAGAGVVRRVLPRQVKVLSRHILRKTIFILQRIDTL